MLKTYNFHYPYAFNFCAQAVLDAVNLFTN